MTAAKEALFKKRDVFYFFAFAFAVGISLFLLDSHYIVEKPPAAIITEARALRDAGKAHETDANIDTQLDGCACVMNALVTDVDFKDFAIYTDDWAIQESPDDVYRLFSYVNIPAAHGKKERRGFVAKMWLPGIRDAKSYRMKCLDVNWF
jgi:hypothetical protein